MGSNKGQRKEGKMKLDIKVGDKVRLREDGDIGIAIRQMIPKLTIDNINNTGVICGIGRSDGQINIQAIGQILTLPSVFFMPEKQYYYSSHGNMCRWSEIRELEVMDRCNYTDEDFNQWEKKYGIVQNDMAIWVTSDRRTALTYADIADNHDKIINLPDDDLDSYEDEVGGLERFHPTDGFLVAESDDGDKGYIMVVRGKEALCRERAL